MIPPQLLLAGIVLAVVLGVVLLYSIISVFLPENTDQKNETLADRANEILPPRTIFGEVDRGFTKVVRDSFWGLTNDGAILWMFLVGGLSAVGALVLDNDLLTVGFAFIIGMFLTYLFFLFSGQRRRRAIQEQLPDGCYQLARGLRAGLPLPEAMRQTSSFAPAPLATVLEKCSQSMSLGLAAPGVMKRSADDVKLTDYDQFASVVALNSQHGGDLPRLLDRLAESIRGRNQFRSYFRSITTLGRISAFFVALGAPVALLIYYLFQRELFNGFWNSDRGYSIFWAAVILEIVGIVWILLLLRKQNEL